MRRRCPVPGIGATGRFIRMLLRLYPRTFRERFGEEMLTAFMDRRDAITQSNSIVGSGRQLAGVCLTLKTALNLMHSAVTERFKQRRVRHGRFAAPSRTRRTAVFSSVASDLRVALRTLGKNPGFTALVVLILAIGIGANTAMFSVMKTVLLEPLPFEKPDRLALLWGTSSDGGYGTVSGPNFLDWQERTNTFEHMSAVGPAAFNLTGMDDSERLNGAYVTASVFDVLATSAAIGRVILSDDQLAAGARVAVLSHGLWQRRFGADPDVVGLPARIDGETHTVVGVMPPGFDVPCPWRATEPGEIWLPFPMTRLREGRGNFSYLILGRLREGATLAAANEDLNAIARRLAEAYPATNEGRGVRVVDLHQAMFGRSGGQTILIFSAATLVLLIACSNVAGLQLVRATTRQLEVAVRTAIGASRGRVVRALLAETLLLSVVGGLAGLLVAFWGLSGLRLVIPSTMPRATGIGLDIHALAFGLFIAIAAGLVFGLVPCLAASRTDLGRMLRESGGRTCDEAHHKGRIHSLFVVAQLALGLVLLNCGALLMRSYGNLRGTDQGFDHSHTLTMAISLSGPEYEGVTERFAYYESAARSLATLPAVHHVGAASKLPLRGGLNARARTEDQPPRSGPADGVMTELTVVISDYFDAMGIPLVAGRTPTIDDTVFAQYGAVINQALAGRLWPTEDPLGKRFTFDENPPEWLTVVGVVGDVHQWGAEREPVPEAYAPYPFFPQEQMYLTLGADTDPAGLVSAARLKLFEIDPEYPAFDERAMEDVLRSSFERREFYTFMTGLFAVTAVVLAAVGLYGIMSQHVAQRTHEIGLRAALGAAPGEVLRLVLGRALRLTAAGLVIGLMGITVSVRLLASLLYQVGRWDPLTLVATTGALAVIALSGSLAPALRATRVSPIMALRWE